MYMFVHSSTAVKPVELSDKQIILYEHGTRVLSAPAMTSRDAMLSKMCSKFTAAVPRALISYFLVNRQQISRASSLFSTGLQTVGLKVNTTTKPTGNEDRAPAGMRKKWQQHYAHGKWIQLGKFFCKVRPFHINTERPAIDSLVQKQFFVYSSSTYNLSDCADVHIYVV